MADLGQIGEHGGPVLVEDLGAHRQAQDGVGAAPAAAIATGPRPTPHGFEMLLIAIVDEGVETVDTNRHDIAAAAAVAAVGTAIFDIGFAAKTDAAGSAVAAFHKDLGLIEEFHGRASAGARPANTKGDG